MLYYGESKSCLELNLIGKGVPLDVTIASQISSAEGTDGDIAEEEADLSGPWSCHGW